MTEVGSGMWSYSSDDNSTPIDERRPPIGWPFLLSGEVDIGRRQGDGRPDCSW